ncbi:MAG: hemolysin family protein [Gemmatimonadota bacterium]
MIAGWLGVAVALAALALFSAYEAALTSLSRIRLRHWVGKQLGGSPAEELLLRPQRLVTMAFVGTNLAKVALGVLAAELLLRRAPFAVERPALAVLAAVALVAFPAVLLGEVLPRTIVRESPGRVLPALFRAGPFLGWLFWPYTALTSAVASGLFAVLRVPRTGDARSHTRDSVEALLREGEREGLVEPHERQIIRDIFSLGETPVRRVMTPRTRMVAVRLGTPRAELARRIWETGFSRFPVVDGAPDNVVGLVHAVDVLKARDGERLRLRPTLFVPETTTCSDLLYAMRRQRIQLAVAVDEYGGVAGIVTMEDLVEELVGEILDEHDVDEGTPAGPGGSGVAAARLRGASEEDGRG